ncbi:ATP-binding protein [Streptomyces sp. RTd22]|uniref:ATP-binding protein n=1 Tax=Streptomyces sp. RTd22 TaxID=1841249 RepID=UPI0007C52337|nr:ATP-binding protein [Streptomyces sp. RTd22]
MTVTRPIAIGAPGYSETMPCEPESASRARRLVRAALNTWDLGPLVEDGTLIISELVGNAARHSGCRLLRVSVRLPDRDRVRLAVTDKCLQPTTAQAPGSDDESGRGLLLVDALADRWDTEYRAWGKIVWAELRARGDS